MASEESKMICDDGEDLEDGEIDDSDEEEVKETEKVDTKDSSNNKKLQKSPSPHRKHNDSKKTSTSKKERSNNQEEDDFMCSIESKIANVLKEKGVEPPMPSIKKSEQEPEQQKASRSSRKRRKRKERKDQKRENNSSKKRTKISDSDNLYMVGGSPDNSGSESDHQSYTSYSSYESDEYHRSTYEERRNKRRDKYSSRNDRDRDRKDRRNRDSEKEICLRFAEYGHCPDDDCPRLHEVRQPKKMELCKFWLMECCAKKEKCSYMHGDFPCKYYYLGLKCINKDCKFMHGKPLSDNLKQILLKHLDTAPKEILGDFPRIGRENATKMISQTHVKLCQEFKIPLPETADKSSGKIPSLLDMKLNPPEEFPKNENRKESSTRSSRWAAQKDSKSTSQQSRNTSSKTSGEPGDTPLTEMRSILSEKQIETMASIGVRTVNHINNLTVSQINDIGLSLATIGEIQATAINMHNKATEETPSITSPNHENTEKEVADIDMRIFASLNEIQQPAKSPDTIMSPNQSDMEGTHENCKPSTSVKTIMMSPPSGIDYSQYLRDSNLNDDENEDEPGLKIDYASDCEADEKKDSQSEDDQSEFIKSEMPTNNVPLLPPSFDTTTFLNSTSVLSKVDISSSIQQLMEKALPSSEKSSHRDPRVRGSTTQKDSSNDTVNELSSPTYKEPASSSIQKSEQTRRTSIYEIESPSEDDEDINIKLGKDKDMRVPPFLRDSENGDVDFRFPFAPMTNYIPATEIEASFGTYVFNKYEVKVVDIPKPDYGDIKRSFQKMDSIQDPRLKKLVGLQDSSHSSNNSSTTSNLDPRKRRQNESTTKDDVVHLSNIVSSTGPKRLQITTILQNSKHYNDLSSSQKMVVNEILSELSKQLKIFHSDKSPSKIFDTTFISHNPRLSQILIGLGVFVNAEGEFEEIKEMPITSSQVVSLPNVHQMPPIIPNIMQQPPPNMMIQPPSFIGAPSSLRPGLLGIAPPNIPPFNFDPQLTISNQGSSYGNEQNFNRNQRQNSNSGNSNSFRNNSHRNNYRSNRR